MKLLSIIIQEAKQVGVLYHFTTIENWRRIKQINMLKATSIEEDISLFLSYYEKDPDKRQALYKSYKKHTPTKGYYISTTRNKLLYKKSNIFSDFNFNYDGDYDSSAEAVRIMLDGNKISNNHKIIPYNYFAEFVGKARLHSDEDEERIILPESTPYLSQLDRYIIRVDLLSFKSTYDKSPVITIDI